MTFSNTNTPTADADAPVCTNMARQPILDKKQSIYGHALFALGEDATSVNDADLIANVLLHGENGNVVKRKPLFIAGTYQTLINAHLDLVGADEVVLEVSPMAALEASEEAIDKVLHTLAEVRKRGFRLAFDERALEPHDKRWLSLASFIKVDITKVSTHQLEQLVRQLDNYPKVSLIAEHIETAEQFELAKEAGATLFQGYWFARPVYIKGQIVRPAQLAVIQLINLVHQEASIAEIEEVFKHDPSLSFNLLRFINSAGFGLSCEITSFRHAVMLLGLKKLFRWAALLMATSGSTGVSSAVCSSATVRGRLMELLAKELLPAEESDNAFLTGIFSMLDTMLGLPMQEALGLLSLPESVSDAILHNSGVMAPLLQLTLACESADDQIFAETAMSLQLTGDQVNSAHLQALAWAENIHG